MGKKIYVNGSIVIKTPDFKYEGAGALYNIPEGAETIETNDIVEGKPCLVIDDERPLSIFNEYYATGFFSTLFCWSYYLNSDYHKAYEYYLDRKVDIEDILDGISVLSSKQQETTIKLLVMNVVTLFDAFVCETIVSKITSTKESFDSFYTKFYNDLSNSNKIHFDNLSRGQLEQEIISHLLERTSYANVKTVNQVYKGVYGLDIEVCKGCNLQDWFTLRHRIVHRNARKKDGSLYVFTEETVKTALTDIDNAVKKIMQTLNSYTIPR